VGFHQVTGHKVAIKILNREKIKSMSMDAKIRREIQILKLFRHPHIIKLYEVIETQTDIFMVMEYVCGGEMFEYIVRNGKLSEDQARKFFQQIIASIDYCHRHRVVHRDLKPENLLLDANNNVKVADFGLSNLMRDGDLLKTPCGSPNYAAPEVISGQYYAGAEVDVWSCGIILYALLCAKLPFEDDYIPDLFKKIRAGKFTFPPHVSEECQQLISSMLVVDQLKRSTIAEIRQHPWVKKNLPPQLKTIPPIIQSPAIFNIENSIVLELAQKFKITKEEVMKGLRKDQGEANSIQVAYRLIEDDAEIDSAKVCSSPPELFSSPPMNMRETIPFDTEDSFFYTKKSEAAKYLADNSQQMWKLGIASTLPPKDILNRFCKVMIDVGVEWKIINEYHLRCRLNSPKQLKFTTQLFKLKSKNYLLDFKKLTGDTCTFFELCSQLRFKFNQIDDE